ncbi:hypothetical protein E3C22_08215 [Jiella endophytica]|uniref:HPr kinase/phosphorylase C-terminal domain-containing protein n=1 Tax=Jiella endophytica TaxID=2558362 RepID=A0A4Y8RQG1_9HYPH|nr:HPr kinase/phosphatase C-terminal domain-containing protein [Jiella endophytica]TFF25335.1 hypothetical protein E3C22_08215 [Jiella endophytica]
MTARANLHASAVALGGRGVLIRGPARSGKSALVLALLRRGPLPGAAAELVADDRVDIEAADGSVRLSAPAMLKGMLEISGIGIVTEPARPAADLWLVADLEPADALPRHPGTLSTEILGLSFPMVRLPRQEAALAADILLTLALSSRLPD